MPATPEDIRRAADPDEAARALLWQEQRRALAAKRTQHLARLAGNEGARKANAEAWAPLKRSPGDAEGP
jgi:hypothetical protein